MRDWYRANLNNNYLGTYMFSSLDAYEAGTPLLYTRSIGDPTLNFFHARIGAYFQDDIRVKKGLTLSPGVRYSYQTRVPRPGGVRAAPRHHVGADQERQHDAAGQRRDLPRLAGPRHLVADGALRRRASARRHHHQPVVSRSRIRRRHRRRRTRTGSATSS